MDFRVFYAVIIEVTRKTIAEMAENGRKWSKKVHRGYLVGNGFPRILRHSPTTMQSNNEILVKVFQHKHLLIQEVLVLVVIAF